MATRSPISYPGAKWKAMPQIYPLLPNDIEDLREPFFGGGSFTINYLQSGRKKPKFITVNDLAPEVYRWWLGMQDNPHEVVKIVHEMYHQYKTPEELWDYVKNVDCETLSLHERSARFYLINKISFSSMGDSGSLSRDRFSAFKFEMPDRIVEISNLLQGVEIKNKSFEEIVLAPTTVDPEKVFIFLDPPYLTQEKSGLYGRGGDTHFGFPHQLHADTCAEAHELGYKWLVTLDDCPKVRKLYQDWEIKPFVIPYTMAMTASNDALQGEEVFISNMRITEDEEDDFNFSF